MTKFYHGTTIDAAFDIARDKAILSPWDRDLVRLTAALRARNVPAHPQELEDMALVIASAGYAPDEIEHRVKCVSVTTDVSLAAFAVNCPEKYGGVILEVELNEPPKHVLYVPRRISLDNLSALYLFGKNSIKLRPTLTQDFSRYSPGVFAYPRRQHKISRTPRVPNY